MEDWEDDSILFSDLSVFLAVYEGRYSQPDYQARMLSHDYSSSQSTSSPNIDTPKSSTDLQQEAHSPDLSDESQAFHHHQDGLTTDLFSCMGGATAPDLTDIEMSEIRELDSSQQPIQNGYVSATQNEQLYTLQYHDAQIASAIQGGYMEGPYGLNPDYNLWPNLTMDSTPFVSGTAQVPYIPGSFVSPTSTSPGATIPVQTSKHISGSGHISPEGATQSGASTFVPISTRIPGGTRPLGVNTNGGFLLGTANPPERSFSRLNRVNATPYPSTPGASIAVRPGRPGRRPSLQPATPRTAREQSAIAVAASSPESTVSSQSREINRGGRKHGLDYQTREKVNQMRKVGVCWVCAFQRDKCDPGETCERCLVRYQRGQLHSLPCVRTHLQDLTESFLSLTINGQYRKESTISFVDNNVQFWQGGAAIRVYLTSTGLGHFEWDLHEFEPSSSNIMSQRRTVLGTSGTWKAIEKRSPPLALKEVNYTQTDKFEKLEKYVEEIMEKYLEQFQDDCFGVEDLEVTFQTDLLKAMCSLYLDLPGRATDKNLKGDVRQVIKMMIITYIMDRAITIVDKEKDNVIRRMRNHNDPRSYTRWTSPMLANRQLKHFFSKMREQQYSQTLNRLHQILRTAQDKNKRWMSSFVLMLGIALVLEQCQHMLWIQAGGRVSRKECTKYDAEFDARAACREIDNNFEFLCKLYHCKYRGKHRKMTRFSEWSSKVYNPAENVFVRNIAELVDRDSTYLYHRQSLDVANSEEKAYSSRLVAKFLVDLFGLDRGSP